MMNGMVKIILFIIIIFLSISLHAFFPPMVTVEKKFEVELSESRLPKTTQDLLRNIRLEVLSQSRDKADLSLILILSDGCLSDHNFLLIPNSFFEGFNNVDKLGLCIYKKECLFKNFDDKLCAKILTLHSEKYMPNLKTIDLQFTLYDDESSLVKSLRLRNLTVFTEKDMLPKQNVLRRCCFRKFDCVDPLKGYVCPGCGAQKPKEKVRQQSRLPETSDDDEWGGDMSDFDLEEYDFGDDGEE